MKNIIAGDAVNKALKKGCGTAEVFVKSSKGISVEAKEGMVDALEVSQNYGIAIKVIKNQKLGFAFTTSPDDMNRTIDMALECAEWTEPDKYVDIPEYKQFKDMLIFDENIKDINEGDIIKDALLLEETAVAFDEKIKKVRKAKINAVTGSTTISNSKGINVTYHSSYYSAQVSTLAQDGSGDSQMGWDYASSRRKSDINIKSIGEGAAKRALELLGSKRITAVKAPVILSPSVAVDFLQILSSSLSADSVQKKRSFLSGKIGRKIISPALDIIDDGMIPWRTGTRPVDDEGTPSFKKTLVAEGILNGYIHNMYTANKDNAASTGNAVRPGFKGLPGVDVTNLYIKADSKSTESNLLSSLSKGMLILSAMGVHTANPVSGDLSVGISGLWIENGIPAYPVKEAVISGNILEMFKKIEAAGGDLTFYGNVGSPSLLIGDMDISA